MPYILPIHPERLAKILNGEKTAEIRTRVPKEILDGTDKEVYLYCTVGKPYLYYLLCRMFLFKKKTDRLPALNGLIPCKFTVEKVYKVAFEQVTVDSEALEIYDVDYKVKGNCYDLSHFITPFDFGFYEKAGMEIEDYKKYTDNGKKDTYAIMISALEIFAKPMNLSDFYTYKKKTVYSGMDCPPYVDEVKTPLSRAPQSWQKVEVRK